MRFRQPWQRYINIQQDGQEKTRMDGALNEEIEGLDSGTDSKNPLNYPLDDVMVRSETRTVGEIMKRVANGRYAMNPDFQRDFVWDKEKQSKLIESCVMRIPLPVFYVAEGADGRVTVVDGLQRLSTFRSFINNDLVLSGLGKHHPLEGKTFRQLAINIQERIEDTQLTLYILDKNAPETARLDIFERVNSGVALTRQQMRNALYNGSATRWLAERAAKNPFKSATGGSLSPKTMRDREAINRFCAFYLIGYNQYNNGDMDDFLALALKKMNKMDDDELENLKTAFIRSMSRNEALFTRHAFRKSLINDNEGSARSVINIALFDVMSVTMSSIPKQVFLDYPLEIKNKTIQMLQDDEFDNYITYSTNGTYQVQGRFRIASRYFGGFRE